MRFPKHEDFAILIMAELACDRTKKFVPLSNIARRHGISVLYLKKVTRLLRRAGLILSKEGVSGGYALAKEPTKMTVWDIIQAVSPLQQVPMDLKRTDCPIFTKCLPQHINRMIFESMEKSLRSISLAHLAA